MYACNCVMVAVFHVELCHFCELIANLYMSLVGETMLCVTLSLEVFDHPLPFMGTNHNVL